MIFPRARTRPGLDSGTMVRLHMLSGGRHTVNPTPQGERAGEAFFIGKIMKGPCSVCGKPEYCKQLCKTHYFRQWRKEDAKRPHLTCTIEGCERPLKTRGWCSVHAQRYWKFGDPLKRLRKANGEGWISRDGYPMQTVDGKERLTHVLVAEKALGKPLPAGAAVHHWDENRSNNDPSNLLICPSNAYHRLIHQRMKAFDSCGNANWRKCYFCQQYSDPKLMESNGHGFKHTECRREATRAKAKKRKEATYVHL